jgi:xanthine dehydrogenase accessory factor
MRDLLAELTDALAGRRPCVYCSVVETRGSTPQKAGAAMLVFADGSQRGTLGGGCVEAEVRQRALHVLTNGAAGAEILTFNLDDNYGWDDGLICGGRMSILADPLGTAAVADYYTRYRQLVESGTGCTEAVIVAPAAGTPGWRYLFDAAGQLAAQLGDGDVPEVVRRGLVPLGKRPAAATREGVAFLPTLPRVTLLIVGGGHVGHAVAKLAAEVDFEVWVLDDRERYASRDRFPSARRHVVGDIGASLQQLVAEVTPSVYALIVTRGHSHDEEALYHLARTLPPVRTADTAAGYVGMIGSRRKIKLIFEDLVAKGVPAEALAKVHAPLGFDIGSQTVPEIAVSIVAELIACRNLGTTHLPVRRRVLAETAAP